MRNYPIVTNPTRTLLDTYERDQQWTSLHNITVAAVQKRTLNDVSIRAYHRVHSAAVLFLVDRDPDDGLVDLKSALDGVVIELGQKPVARDGHFSLFSTPQDVFFTQTRTSAAMTSVKGLTTGHSLRVIRLPGMCVEDIVATQNHILVLQCGHHNFEHLGSDWLSTHNWTESGPVQTKNYVLDKNGGTYVKWICSVGRQLYCCEVVRDKSGAEMGSAAAPIVNVQTGRPAPRKVRFVHELLRSDLLYGFRRVEVQDGTYEHFHCPFSAERSKWFNLGDEQLHFWAKGRELFSSIDDRTETDVISAVPMSRHQYERLVARLEVKKDQVKII